MPIQIPKDIDRSYGLSRGMTPRIPYGSIIMDDHEWDLGNYLEKPLVKKVKGFTHL